MISKIYYAIVAALIIITLVACELFEEGYGDKVDLSDPVITFDTPSAGDYVHGTFTLKGTCSDDVSVSSVIVTFTSTVTGESVSKSGTVTDSNWYVDIESTDDSEYEDGELEFKATVTDTSDKTSYKTKMIYIDNSIPTVLVSSPDEDEIEIVNGDLTISGEVDDLKLDYVEVYIISEDDSSISYGGVADGTSSFEYTIDTVAESLGVDTSETYYLEVTAYDDAGNSNTYFYYNDDLSSVKDTLGVSTVSMDDLSDEDNDSVLASIQRSSTSNQLLLEINQNEDMPQFEDLDEWDLENADNYTICDDDEIAIDGKITDDDGLSSITLTIFDDDGTTVILQGTADGEDSTSYNLEIYFETAIWDDFTMSDESSSDDLSEGLYYFNLTATDNVGDDTGTASISNKAYFAIDKTAPTIGITFPESDDDFNDDFTITGTVYDAVNIDRVEITISSNDSEDEIVTATLNSDLTEWTYTVDVSDLSGSVDITAKAYDGNGHSNYETVKIYVDNILPVLDPDEISYPDDVNGLITLTGIATDTYLDYVAYKLWNSDESVIVWGSTLYDDVTIDEDDYSITWQTGSLDGTSWSFDVDTTAFYSDSDDDYGETSDVNMQIWAYDESGNSSIDLESGYNILTIDESSDLPVINFITPDDTGNYSYPGSVVIWLEISDDDGVDTASINFKLDGIEYSSFTTSGTDPVTIKYYPEDSVDGSYSLSVSVDDTYGLTGGTSETVAYTADSDGPVVEVEDTYDSLTYQNDDFIISGTALDTMGGVEFITITASFDSGTEIEYEYDTSTSVVDDFDLEDDGTWSLTVDTSSIVDSDDALTLSINATDYAGNASGVTTRNFIVDKSDPVESASLTSSSTNLNGTVELSGEVSDDYLNYVQIYVSDSDFNTWENVTEGSYSWKQTLDTTLLTDGDNTIYIHGVDKAGNDTATEYTISVDQDSDLPTISFDSFINSSATDYSDNTLTEEGTLSGDVEDDDGILTGSIKVTFYTEEGSEIETLTASETVDSSTKTSWSVDLSDLKDSDEDSIEGQYSFTVTVSDDSTVKVDSTEDSLSTTSSNVKLLIDNGAPELTEEKYSDESLNYINEDVTLSGTASDGIVVSYLEVLYEKDGADAVTLGTATYDEDLDSYTISGNITYDGESWTSTLGTALGDGEYEITIEARDTSYSLTDGTGYSQITRRIEIDTEAPVLEVDDPITGDFTTSSTYTISGTSRDYGVGFPGNTDGDEERTVSITYTITDNIGAETTETVTTTSTSSSWSYELDFDTTDDSTDNALEGSLTFTTTCADDLGNSTSTETITLYYDASNPTLTEDDLNTTDTVYIGEDQVFSGTISDTNAISTLEVSIDGESYYSDIESSIDYDTNTWSFTFDIDGEYTTLDSDEASYTFGEEITANATEGSYNIIFRATDVANKTTEVTRNIVIDTSAPTILFYDLDSDSDDDDTYLNGSITINGTASDSSSGVASVEYYLDETWITASGTSSWLSSLDLTSDEDEGSYTVYVRVTDYAGNVSDTESQGFYVDNNNPEVSIDVSDSEIKGDIIVNVSSSDSYSLKSTTLYYSIDDADEVEFDSDLTNFTIGDNGDDDDTTWTYTIGSENGDGEYSIRVVAEDDAGKSDEDSLTITLDTEAPVLTITANSSLYYQDTFTVSGTSSDTISGVASVEYSIDDGTTWYSDLSGTSYWYGDLDISDEGYDLAIGTNTINVRTTDNFGNISSTTSQDFIRDTADPTTGLTSADWSSTTYKTADFTLSGTAGDDYSLSSITVSGDGLSSDYVVSEISTDDVPTTTQTWSKLIEPGSQGEKSITVTIEDSVGRTTDETISYFYDDTAPEVLFTNLTSGDTVGSASYTFVGSGTDTDGSGVTLVEYRHTESGADTISDTDSDTGEDLYPWTTATGTTTWSFQLTGLSDSDTQYIEVRATDNCGKVSDATALSFTVDTSVPEISTIYADRTEDYDFADEVTVSTNQYYGGDYDNFALRIAVYDAIGITAVTLNIPGNDDTVTTDDKTITFTDTTYTDTDTGFSLWGTDTEDPIDISTLDDGNSIWTFTVTDSSGLKSTATRTVQIDNSAPVITYSYPDEDDVVNGEVEVSGLGEDDGYGLSTIQYKIGYNYEDESWEDVEGSVYSWEINFPSDDFGNIEEFAGLEVSSVDDDDTITMSSHGYSDGTAIWVGAESLTGDLTSTTTYYIYESTTDTFQLVSTEGSTSPVSIEEDEDNSNGLRISKYAKDSDANDIWELPILVQAIDNLGNTNTSDDETYVVYVDPTGDIPTINISYPDSGDTLGGIVRIYGSAEDDDGVDAVYMTIDVDGDGDYDAADVVISGYDTLEWIDDDDDGDYDSYTVSGDDTVITDWYNSGDGLVVDGSVSWNQSINTDGEFDSEDDSRYNTIYYKVRAEDINFLSSDWTESQEIIIDDDAPTIGSSVAAYLTDADDSTDYEGGTEQSYTADMWISDTWTLVVSIEDESGIGEVYIQCDEIDTFSNGITYTYSEEDDEIGNSAYFEAYENTDNDTSGYIMYLPIDTDSLSGNSLTLTLEATEISNSNPSTNSEEFSINFDNDAPTLGDYDGDTPIVQSNYTYEVTSTVTESGSGLERVAFYFFRADTNDSDDDRLYNPLEMYESGDDYITYDDDDKLTYTSDLIMPDDDESDNPLPRLELSNDARVDEYSFTNSLIEDNYNIRVGGLVKIGGIDRLITEVDYSAGTVTWGDSVDTSYTDAYFAYAMIVDNFTTETAVWSDSTMTSVTNGDGDYMVEAIDETGGYYEWSAYIDSTNIPDGPITLYWVAYDESGNYSADSITTTIQNNAPMLASVTLGTDLDEDGAISTDEQNSAYSLLSDATGDYQSEAEAESTGFTAKDLTTIEIEVVGGNGLLSYQLGTTLDEEDVSGILTTYSIDGDAVTYNTDTVSDYSLTTLRASEDSDENTIYLTTTNFKDESVGEGDKYFYIKIWDSTEETTVGNSSQWAMLTLPFEVDVVDGVDPTVAITDLYWTSETDNSLYGNSSENGHIEVNDTGNDDVSGQVSVTGTVSDDQRIDEIYMSIDYMTIIGIDSSDEDEVVDTYTESDITYNMVGYYENESWTVADEWADNGWTFTVTDAGIDQDGHELSWQLDWDTSFISTIAHTDVEINLIAIDKGDNSHTDTYTVDVVPYITDVDTELADLKSNNPSVYNRTALGHYPVSDTETIYITGFNLSGTTVGTYDAVNNYVSLDMSGYVSGDLALAVNGISTTNNSNDNDNDYNKQSNEDNNTSLTDDVSVDVWEINSEAAETISGEIADPVMKINPVSGIIGFAFTNGPLYFSMGGTVSGTEYSYYFWQASYDFMSSIAFTYDDEGNSFGATAGGDINSSSADNFSLLTSLWGISGLGSGGSYNGSNALRLEKIGQKVDSVNYYNKYRIESPQYATSVHGETSNIYMTFYDDMNDEISFRYGNISHDSTAKSDDYYDTDGDDTGESGEWGFDNFIDEETSRTVSAYDIGNESIVVGADSLNKDPGKYVAIGVVPGATAAEDVVVMVWYDATSLRLMYSYNTSPTTDRRGTIDGDGWSTAIEVFEDGGQYCQLDVDENGSIHIAAYDNSNGDLVYAYLSSYSDTTIETSIVDSFGIVGAEITLDTALDSDGNAIPYIGYYSNSSVRPKYAYKINTSENAPNGAVDDVYTGDWEITLIPTESTVDQDRINVGVWTDDSGEITTSTTGTSYTYDDGSSTYNATSYGVCYGNGTSNGVIAYAITESSDGFIETAQMK